MTGAQDPVSSRRLRLCRRWSPLGSQQLPPFPCPVDVMLSFWTGRVEQGCCGARMENDLLLLLLV